MPSLLSRGSIEESFLLVEQHAANHTVIENLEEALERSPADAKAEQEAVNQRALMLRQQSWDAGLGGGRTPSPTPRTEDMYQVAPS